MISFTRIEIESLDSYENLKTAVPTRLIDDEVIKVLKRYLGERCDEIQIEYPYYDSDYLSTYYIHYSQKLRPYEKMCCRLHILKKEEYYGYIVLRPTTKGTKIGKTFIKPELLVSERAYLMLHNFKAHVAGNEMEIRSFPWKSQETDISVCAHTAAWTVIRYFGNKFRDYADTTIGALVEHTKNDWGRKTPSLGLTPVQVSDLFKDYNFSPLILQCDKDEDGGFLDELVAYIESGIPMIGFLYPIKHAVSIIGHGLINYDRYTYQLAVASTSGFTACAQEFAATHRISLIEFDKLPFWNGLMEILGEDKENVAIEEDELKKIVKQISSHMAVAITNIGQLLFLCCQNGNEEVDFETNEYDISFKNKNEPWTLKCGNKEYLFQLPEHIAESWIEYSEYDIKRKKEVIESTEKPVSNMIVYYRCNEKPVIKMLSIDEKKLQEARKKLDETAKKSES